MSSGHNSNLFPSDYFSDRFALLMEKRQVSDLLHRAGYGNYRKDARSFIAAGAGKPDLAPRAGDIALLVNETSAVVRMAKDVARAMDEDPGALSAQVAEGGVLVVFDREYPLTEGGELSPVDMVRMAAHAGLEGEGMVEAAKAVARGLVASPDPLADLEQGEIYYADVAVSTWGQACPEIPVLLIVEVRSYLGELHNRLRPDMAAGLYNPRTMKRMVHPGNPAYYTWAPAARFWRHPCASGAPRFRSRKSFYEVTSYPLMPSYPRPYVFRIQNEEVPGPLQKTVADGVPEEIKRMLVPGMAELAGGALVSILNGETPNDYDIYINGGNVGKFIRDHGLAISDEFDAAAFRDGALDPGSLGTGRTLNDYYNSNICIPTRTGSGLAVDLVVCREVRLYHPIEFFDLTLVQLAYDGEVFKGKREAFEAHEKRTFEVRFSEAGVYNNTYARIRKYEARGYTFRGTRGFETLVRSWVPLRPGPDLDAWLEMAPSVPDFPAFPVIRGLVENRAMGEAEARGSLPSGWGTIRARMERAEARLWSSYMALTPAFAVAAKAILANGDAEPYVPGGEGEGEDEGEGEGEGYEGAPGWPLRVWSP
jgi:hypothetical protein